METGVQYGPEERPWRKIGNYIAPEGQVWVCGACLRTSRDRYGFQKIDRGWDESCMMAAVLCYEEKADGEWRAVERRSAQSAEIPWPST